MTMIAKFKLFLFFALTSFGIAVNLFILVLFNDWSYSNLTTTSAGCISDSALLPSFQKDIDGDARYTNALLPSSSNASREDGPGLAHCFYRMYNDKPSPGLPIVVEVFASSDRTQVFVVVESHLGCHRADRKAHNFHSVPGVRNVTFDCIFEADGSRTTSLPVHRAANGWHLPMVYNLVQCPVPSHLTNTLPLSRSRITNSFLSLQANMNDSPAEKRGNNNSNNGTTTPSPKILPHLPICSHAWPPEPEDESFPIAVPPKKRHKISLMTRVKLDYQRGDDGQRLVVSPLDFATWLEYHLTLGMDHIYIYDNSLDRFNSTVRQLCRPYVQRGLVTYINYPREDVWCDHRLWRGQKNKGNLYSGQFLSSNSVLRRYDNETEWMAHWDIDEYLLLPSMSSTSSFEDRQAALYNFIDRHGRQDQANGSTLPLYDEVSVWRYGFGICNMTSSEPNSTIVGWTTTKGTTRLQMDLKRCRARTRDLFNKGIYRSSTVFYVRIHTSEIAIDSTGSTTKNTIVNEINPREGYLGHFREGKAAGDDFPIVPALLQEPFLDHKWVEMLHQNLLSRGFDPELVGPSSLFLFEDQVQKNFSQNLINDVPVVSESRGKLMRLK